MTSRNSTSFRASGQRSIPSTFLSRPNYSCFTSNSNASGVTSDKNKGHSNVSLSSFLNRKLHKTSVLPINKDNKKYSVVEKESSSLAVECNPQNESSAAVEQCGFEGPHDGGARVIEDSVFKLFNDSGGRVRKRSADCITGASRLEGDSKQQSQKHLLVLGDDPKPKRRAHERVSCSYKEPRPLYNHYESGTGWWEPEREGVDSDEVGSAEVWEGMGSTTLGGLDWHG
ncbi:hypothetical protein BVRB_3g060050 [Beta vulgaris subsp. vulgaris]|nr:hypothetical protein BVRB_3g060050 [Beta vulgaris subsp. vulgaris]